MCPFIPTSDRRLPTRMDQLKWLLLKYDLFFPILLLFKTLSQVSLHYLVQISIAGNVIFDICKMF